MRARSVRAAAIAGCAAIVFVALAAPAGAGKRGVRCSPFAPAIEGAADSEVVKITPRYTEAKPFTIDIEHAAAMYPVATEDKYVNIQIAGPGGDLYIREEFGPVEDIDLYLYDAAGGEAASSGAFNPAPVPGVLDADGNGGSGFESINAFAVSSCSGWTINSHAYMTPGTTATLTVWLAK